MTIEAETQPNQEITPSHRDPHDSKPDSDTPICLSIQTPEPEKFIPGFNYSEKFKKTVRLCIFVTIVVVLFAGRFSVPDNEVSNVQDKVLDALGFANRFINTPGNEHYRDFFQAFCSFLLDIIFIVTLGYWVMYGKSSRLPISFLAFYGVRAIVQSFWMSPFPEGNYWYSPGFPSLVVPYGRQSDFFFSGHSGFLIICASEWHSLKFPRIRNFILGTAVYTILVLLAYRTHYSIDVFTGVVYAELCFCKADAYKEIIDAFFASCYVKLRNMLGHKDVGLPCLEADKFPLTAVAAQA